MAALVREAVLAAEPTVAWPLPAWWTRPDGRAQSGDDHRRGRHGRGAAVLLIILAVRQLGAARRAPAGRRVRRRRRPGTARRAGARERPQRSVRTEHGHPRPAGSR